MSAARFRMISCRTSKKYLLQNKSLGTFCSVKVNVGALPGYYEANRRGLRPGRPLASVSPPERKEDRLAGFATTNARAVNFCKTTTAASF